MAVYDDKKALSLGLLFSDIVGYTKMLAENQAQGIELLTEYRTLVRRTIPIYAGREQDTIGDGFFVEFGSVEEAVRCAIEIQSRLHERNLLNPTSRQLRARIGIHYGEVVAVGNSLAGEAVNLASRVEALADAGGICITAPVAEQLESFSEITLRKMGRRELKGFATPVQLFHVRSIWEGDEGNRWGRILNYLQNWGSNNQVTEGALHLKWLLATILLVFCFFGVQTWEGLRKYPARTLASLSPRTPASEISKRVLLNDGWSYANFSSDNPNELSKLEKSVHWLALKTHSSWKLTETLSSPYWLKKDFGAIMQAPQHPAMVLGLVAGAHRVYLNGVFIGGSNHFFAMAYYAFDRRLLNNNSANELLIQVSPKSSLTPGLRTISYVGAFLGEFNDVNETVLSNEYYYHVFLSVYFAISFLLSAICALFYLFNRSERKYLYFSLFLLLGSMELFYYNGLVGSVLDFRFHRACKLLALSVSSLVLFSTYLHLMKIKRWEERNNLLAVLWSGVVLILTLFHRTSPNALVERSNFILVATLLYSVVWVSSVVIARFIQIVRDRGKRSLFHNSIHYEATVVIFGFLMGMLAYRSLELELVFSISPLVRDILLRLGSTYPFIFAGLILISGVFDYITKNRAVTYQEKKDDLILSIVESLTSAPNSEVAISTIHRKIVGFVGAERSTLYLLSQNKRGILLKASYLVQKTVIQHHIQKTVYPRGGVIGYVCQSLSPLLIRDISKDFRFREHLKERNNGKKSSYKTDSCMLFPLITRGQLVGILTLADKLGGQAFTRDDFSLVNVVSRDLALLIDNERLTQDSVA